MKTPAVIAFAALACAAFATTAAADPPPPNAGGPPMRHHACFWTQNVENFAAHDDNVLYVRVNISDVYELKLMGDCFNLSWLHHIALSSEPSPRICEGESPNVEVLIHDRGIGRQRCPVINVRQLTPAEIAALPKDARP